MNERIKKLRKVLDLTQQEFGDRIGIKRNTLANYEIGRNEPIDAVIALICREFNVNEKWLRNGTGEMFNPTPETSIDKLVDKFHLGELERQIILEFIWLDEKDRKGVIEYVQRLVQNQVLQAAQRSSKTMTLEQEADEFAAMAREQFIFEKKQASQALFVKESGVG